MSKELFYACSTGDYETVSMLLKDLIDINELYYGNNSLLYIASRHGHTNIVELLLDHGAYINTRDIVMFTPLMIAVTCGHIDVVRVLLDRGADMTLVSLSEKTVKRMAEERGSQEMKELIDCYLETPIKVPEED